MADGEFCVLCGRTGRPLVDGVCAECAAGREPLVRVPEQVEVVLCPQCGARFRRGQWTGAGASAVLSGDDLGPFLEVHPDAGVRSVRWEERARSRSLREISGEEIGRASCRERVFITV